jgi:hypothetical protein
VCDFEPGIVTSPQSRDFLQTNFIGWALQYAPESSNGVNSAANGPHAEPPSIAGIIG